MDGWVLLAGADRDGAFPPTLNKDQDPALLRPWESPDCYGVDSQKDGRLARGTVLTGTARTAPTKTANGQTWHWYYDRLWRASSASLIYGCPAIYTIFKRQNNGSQFEANAAIVTFLPVGGSDMAVVTASGTHWIQNAFDPRGFFELGKFSQEMKASTATYVTELNGLLYVCNASGVFSWDGNKVTELTRPVRDSLGSFASTPILADYQKGAIVGTSKFVVDAETGKLFDYGTSGFRFTSRTLTGESEYRPLEVNSIAFAYERTNAANATIKWQTKVEDGDWYDEPDIVVHDADGERTRTAAGVENPNRTTRRFAMRITSLPANLRIREIRAEVTNCAQSHDSE